MAKGKKTGGNDFVKGHSVGRPTLPDDIREARRLNRFEFDRIANQYAFATKDELKFSLTDEKLPMIDRLVIRVMMTADELGSYQHLGFVLDRLIGKVAEKQEVRAYHYLSDLPDQELIDQAKEAIQFLQRQEGQTND